MSSTKDQPNFHVVDVTKPARLRSVISYIQPGIVIHLPALLSGASERHPDRAIALNVGGFMNILELAREFHFKLFVPSTIAVYGGSYSRTNTPEVTALQPTSIYGITKMYIEKVGEYYAKNLHLDYRSLRLPGILSSDALTGGGTTDYAVEMIRAAHGGNNYKCFLEPSTRLPMLYIEDCLHGIMQLISADNTQLSRRVYNITAFSFTPTELMTEIENITGRRIHVTFEPDFRQNIANSWPTSLDDGCARRDWKWNPALDLRTTVARIWKDLDNQKL